METGAVSPATPRPAGREWKGLVLRLIETGADTRWHGIDVLDGEDKLCLPQRGNAGLTGQRCRLEPARLDGRGRRDPPRHASPDRGLARNRADHAAQFRSSLLI